MLNANCDFDKKLINAYKRKLICSDVNRNSHRGVLVEIRKR